MTQHPDRPQRLKLAFIQDPSGALHLPADQVAALLRRLGDQWQQWTQAGDADLDHATVQALAGHLRSLADQIDVEAIARRDHGTQDDQADQQEGER